MAALENEHLVVNVVYTGPPLAGKTQSVRALMPLLEGRGVEQKVLSPGDWRGRTAFFDWAVYEGGAYEGKSIQCRIISTPGQVALSERREMLLRAADAVILVIDSQADTLERAVHCYEEMAPWLAEASRAVPLRLVLQCNKQDLPGSLPADELSRRLGVPCGKDVYATSAATGKGLRAAFVAAVRNAVERARALVARGIVLEAPDVANGEELFERMRREVAPIGSGAPPPAGAARQGRSKSAPPAAPASALAATTPSAATSAPARPGSSAPASAPGARPATTARPNERSSARGGARSQTESARPNSSRGSSKAATSRGSSSSTARPAASRGAAGSASAPFGPSKPKSTSGFYPTLSARSSGSPARTSTSHPPLPPDHPFAPTRPTPRRTGATSSRPGSTATSSAPDTSGALPRPKSNERTAPPGADEPARSPRQPRPSSAARATPAPGLPVAAPLRSSHGERPKAAAASDDAIAARSGESATGGAAASRGDTRPSLRAVAARAAAEASTARAPASSESPASATGAPLMPAASAGSAPPSSGTASAPASSARRAILPPHAEPGADRAREHLPEPGPLGPSSPHPKGWLDPAGRAAREWRPGQGPRPAIMPAAAHHALVPAELEARRERIAAAATAAAAAAAEAERRPRARADAASDAGRRDVRLDRAPKGRPQAPPPAEVRASARPFVDGGPRPAVMPASAYRAAVTARARLGTGTDDACTPGAAASAAAEPATTESAAGKPAASERTGSPSALPRSPRPAVMPASAYRAWLAAGGAAIGDGSTQLAAHTEPGAAFLGEAALQQGRAVRPANDAAPSPASREPSARPAVMPASAWRAALAAGEEMPTRAAPAARASSPPAAKARGAAPLELRSALGADDDPVDSAWPEAGDVLSLPPPFESPLQHTAPKARRPAVMPASAWRALVERGELPGDGVEPARDPEAAAAGAPGAGALEAALGSSASVEDEWPAPPRDGDGPWREARGARSLRLLRGGTPNRRGDEPRSPPARPSLTLLERPAVMPAGAWRHTTASPPGHGPSAPPRAGSARPAVMPASAWRATLEADQVPLPREALSIDVPNDAQARGGAGFPASDPPAPPAEGGPANDTPTIAPPSDRVSSTERPTIVASALAEPALVALGSTPAELADPASFGLEPSRSIEPQLEPPGAHADESSESFRIPETPPGLQAFVARARLSTPPPVPASSDDVIPSLAPSRSQPALDAEAIGGEPHAPPEFAGPRMPGHVRAPRAVWRRSTWRTLETHITSDAVALEDARGRWIGELAPGWYARTLRSAPDARTARRAFAEEVLRERRLGQYLSRPRCVALTAEADRYWIWQAACRVPTLAAVLGRRLGARESPSAMAEALLDASLAFVEARQRFIQARVPLPLSLHALSVQDDELVYSGLLPDPGAVFVHPPSDGHAAFEEALRKKWPGASIDGSAVFAELSGKAAGRLPEPILAIIRSVVGQSSIETSTNEVSG